MNSPPFLTTNDMTFWREGSATRQYLQEGGTGLTRVTIGRIVILLGSILELYSFIYAGLTRRGVMMIMWRLLDLLA